MTQAQVEFQPRRLEDWHTPLNDVGRGGFGVARLAYDDRPRLLHMQHGRAIDVPIYSDYHLNTDPPDAARLREMEAPEAMVYLSQYSRDAILRVYLTEAKRLKRLSRYDLILKLVESKGFGPIQWDESRDVVVIKLIGPEFAQRGGDLRALQKQSIRSAKTEVYALSRVSSVTNVYHNVGSDGGTNVANDGDELNVEVIPPVNCIKLFDSVTPVVCLKDYFMYTGQLGDVYAVVLSYTRGQSLQQLMDNCSAKLNIVGYPKPFPALFVWYTAWTMLHVLEHVHYVGIIHNDVKLENIVWDNTKGELTLIDFGLSCHVTLGEGLPGTKDYCDARGGTPDYTPPEYAVAPYYRFPVSDIWALGIVLWELATGQTYSVSGADHLAKFGHVAGGARPDLNAITPYNMWKYEEFIALLEGMLQMDPRLRWTSTDAIAHLLRTFETFSGPDKSSEAVGHWLYERAKVPECYLRAPPQLPRGRTVRSTILLPEPSTESLMDVEDEATETLFRLQQKRRRQ